MIKLQSLSPEIVETLRRIGVEIGKREEIDPIPSTFCCYRCSDTGFIVTQRKAIGGPSWFGCACEHCLAGKEIERMQASWKSKKSAAGIARMSQRLGNKTLMFEEPVNEDEAGDNFPF